MFCCFVFFKQTTAYEMRISDWSSDVCSSDLVATVPDRRRVAARRDLHARFYGQRQRCARLGEHVGRFGLHLGGVSGHVPALGQRVRRHQEGAGVDHPLDGGLGDHEPVLDAVKSEEHTSELQSLMRISYAVFCLKKKKT